jgi:hypothetical protein
MTSVTFVAVSLCALCAAMNVRADDLDKPMFSFAGFGTVGLAHSSNDQADFASSYLKPNGAGYSTNWSGNVDSRIGAQVTGNFTSDLSAIVQVISQQRYDSRYLPTVEWANVRYQVTSDLSVRIGRIALPTFLEADYRNVGYAIPWVRTPGEVNDLVSVTNSDGIDIRFRSHLGDLKDTLQGSFGTTNINYPGDGHVAVRAIRGITNTTEYGPTTVRLSYLQGNFSLDVGQPLFDAFRQFGPQGSAIADKYSGENKVMTYVGIGVNYDPGEWFAMGELGKTNSHSFIGDKTAGYVSGGYRIGKLTPYVTLAQVKADSNRSDPGLGTAGLPPYLAGEAVGLNAGVNVLLNSIAVQHSISIGMRWDLMKNAALKVQCDSIRLGANSSGDLVNMQPGFVGGGKVNVVSTVLDFVF